MSSSTIHKVSALAARASFVEPLPASMQDQARRRLNLLARIMLPFVVLHVVLVVSGAMPPLPISVTAALVLVTVLLWVVTGLRRTFSTPFALSVGLFSQFAYSLVLSIPLSIYASTELGVVVEGPWTYIIMLAFPLIVPMSPRQLLRGLVASGLTVPLGTYLSHRALGTTPDMTGMIASIITPVFVVSIGWYGARIIYGVALAAAQAEDLGSYRLESLIGKGGMGEVWRARHRMLTRPAAIKLILLSERAGGSAETTAARFAREAQATALLQSPHTVQVYDFGTAEDGRFFYVMELLNGLDLEEFVEKHGPMEPARVIHIARQLCHSLAEAHARGLVHRDVKPANVFLCRYGRDTDFVKVLDFGLVLAASATSSGYPDPRLTDVGTAQGTPAYMAPETVTDPDNVGAGSDLYAVGCVLYWLLTGRLVFDRQTAMQAIVAHTTEAPIPPAKLSELPVPAALDALVMRLLEKSPRDRFASAGAVIEALDALAKTHPWSAQDSDAWWGLHRPAELRDVEWSAIEKARKSPC